MNESKKRKNGTKGDEAVNTAAGFNLKKMKNVVFKPFWNYIFKCIILTFDQAVLQLSQQPLTG